MANFQMYLFWTKIFFWKFQMQHFLTYQINIYKLKNHGKVINFIVDIYFCFILVVTTLFANIFTAEKYMIWLKCKQIISWIFLISYFLSATSMTLHWLLLVGFYLGHLIISIGIALVLTITIESPFIRLEKILLGGSKHSGAEKLPAKILVK